MNNYITEFTLINRLDEIEKALKNEMWQSALALALTIPDICGDRKRFSNVGPRYKAWFREHAERYFTWPSYNSLDKTETVEHCFTAEMCYKLRCDFLHEGRGYDPSEKINNYTFQYRIYGASSIERVSTYGCNDEHTNVTVDITQLCQSIVSAAHIFYKNSKNKERLDKAIFAVQDISKYQEINKRFK